MPTDNGPMADIRIKSRDGRHAALNPRLSHSYKQSGLGAGSENRSARVACRKISRTRSDLRGVRCRVRTPKSTWVRKLSKATPGHTEVPSTWRAQSAIKLLTNSLPRAREALLPGGRVPRRSGCGADRGAHRPDGPAPSASCRGGRAGGPSFRQSRRLWRPVCLSMTLRKSMSNLPVKSAGSRTPHRA